MIYSSLAPQMSNYDSNAQLRLNNFTPLSLLQHSISCAAVLNVRHCTGVTKKTEQSCDLRLALRVCRPIGEECVSNNNPFIPLNNYPGFEDAWLHE